MKYRNRIKKYTSIDPKKVRRNPRNWRIHPDEQRDVLQGVLEEVGIVDGIKVVPLPDGTFLLVDGELRSELITEQSIPALILDLNDTEVAKILALFDAIPDLAVMNKEKFIDLAGEFNSTNAAVQKLVADLAAIDVQMRKDAEELAGSLSGGGEGVRHDDADEEGCGGEPRGGEGEDVEHTPTIDDTRPPRTKTGEVIVLGDHRLVCGDSFDPEIRRLALDGRLADCVLMDPPFAIFGSSTGVGSDVTDDSMIRPFFTDLGRVVMASCRECAHVYTCCDWRSWAAIWESYRTAGTSTWRLEPKNMLVWDKGDGGMGANYMNGHELIAFHAKLSRRTGSNQITSFDGKQRTVNGHSNIRRHTRPTGDERHHNAAKPVKMFVEFIENSTDPGETVLDLFGGSGTVLIACQRTGRRCVTIEKEPRWCDVIRDRYASQLVLAPHT